MNELERVLDQCWDDIMSGRASVEECLGRHPDLREELEPLLRLATALPTAPDVHPSGDFRRRARLALQREIDSRGAWPRMRQRLTMALRPAMTWRLQFAAPLLVGLLVTALVLGSGGAVAFASQDSLPGDILYPVKTATERGRLLVTFSSSGKAEYRLELAQERLDEVVGLVRSGASVDPGTIEAIARQIDVALADLRRSPPDDVRALMDTFSAGLERKAVAIEGAREKASSSAQKSLDDASVIAERGKRISEAVSEKPSRLETPVSVQAAREGEVEGTISSLEPLTIGRLRVVTTSSTRVDGGLAVGGVASAKGTFREDGALVASRIQVQKDAEPTKVEFKGVITSLDPLVVAGREVVTAQDTETRGVLEIGLMAGVRGRTEDGGPVVASRIEVERLRQETEIHGVITSVEPLTVGNTVIALARGAEKEGILRVGATVEVKGRFLDDGMLLAANIEVLEDKGRDKEDEDREDNEKSQGREGQGDRR